MLTPPMPSVPDSTTDAMLTLRAAPIAVLDSALDAVVCCTPDGTIAMFNSAAERLYGRRREDAVGAPVDVLVSEDRRVEQADLVRRVMDGERVVHYDAEHVHSGGAAVELSVTVSPVVADDERRIGVSFVARDISERLALEHELAESRRLVERQVQQLERSNADLEQFAYVASHDLSEPLRTIAGMLELLSEEYGHKLGEEADDYIDRAVRGAARMRALIDDLLAYSRLGRREEALRPVAVDEILAAVTDGLAELIESSGATVAAPTALPTVDADPRELHQLLQNLITNGLKFNASDAPRVEISAQRDGGRWLFTVTDNGIGVPADHHRRIFGVFKRLHGRDVYPGTGVGLAICERIVERHGGRIWLEPTGEGTCLCFTLPPASAAAGAEEG